MNYIEKNYSFDSEPLIYKREGETPETELPKTLGESFQHFIKAHFTRKGADETIRNIFPSLHQRAGENIRRIVQLVSAVLFVVSLSYILNMYAQYSNRLRIIDELEGLTEPYENIAPENLDEAWKDIKAQYPEVSFPDGMNIAFAPLYAINSDIVGKLTIPNTNIATNVMQNGSYYLYKNFYGQYSRYGMPYVDERVSIKNGKLPKNTIIYGHNTHDGMMFNQLTKYMTVDGYKQSPIIVFSTLYGTTKWKVFAAILTNSTYEADNGNLYNFLQPNFSSDAAFSSYLREISVRNMLHTGVDVNSGDRILSLYTCYQSIFKGGRLIVFARELREGENESVDLSNVYYNSSARFPQAYYDARELKNPYYDGTHPETTKNSNVTVASSEIKTTKAPGKETTVSSPRAEETTGAPETTAVPPQSTEAPPEKTEVLPESTENIQQ